MTSEPSLNPALALTTGLLRVFYNFLDALTDGQGLGFRVSVAPSPRPDVADLSEQAEY